MQIHQNEYISTLQEAGGIAEEGLPLNKLWQEYMQRKNPSKPMPRPLDRRTVKILATVLEKRGLVKRSTLQFQTYEGKMVQRPVIYLAHITLDSPAMRDFAIAMQEKVETPIAGAKNWLKKRQTLIETDEMAVAPVAKRRGRKPAEQIPITPRPYFLKNWRIVAQYFGWQYGFLARTRTLHQHLVASITDDNDSPFIISSEPRTRIFSTPFVLLETPLSIFMQISAVSEYSEALEQFLQTEDPTKVAMKDLPGELSTLLASKKTKGYSRFSQLFHALIVLKLLVPVEQVEYKTPIVAYSGREREPRYFGAKEDGSTATYWLLLSQAPLYDLQEREEKEQKLLGQLPVITVEEATQYWETLQGLTFNSVDVQSLPKATVKYPPTLNASSTFIHAARTAAHWRPQYALLAQQKMYLRRTLAEVASKNDLLADENKLKELAFNVCAPMDIVRAYLAKPQHGAVPEWAKKRKRRSAIAQKSSVSDTSASEAEGPGAPRPRSQATGEAILERKRAQKAARHAARVRMQQQIIARKAQGAREAKEAVWDGIVNGFRMLHGEDALKVVQLDFLHTWFMSPDGPTATTIQQHLEQAVEGVSTSFVDFSARSSLASKTGSIGNRAEKQRMKNVPRRPKSMIVPSMPHGEEIFLHAMPDLPEGKSLQYQSVRICPNLWPHFSHFISRKEDREDRMDTRGR